MKAIARVQTTNREVDQLQSNILSRINAPSSTTLSEGIILSNQALKSGSNSINHKLDRALQGWYIVRQRSAASIYDTQDANKTPDKTLNLQSTADVTVDIYVF